MDWFSHVFDTLGVGAFKDKELVLRSAPVLAAVGAIGKAYYDGGEDARLEARNVIEDPRIDWTIGPQWNGICGKVNPNTGKFSVGSAKEYGNGAYNALTRADTLAWNQIRPEVAQAASPRRFSCWLSAGLGESAGGAVRLRDDPRQGRAGGRGGPPCRCNGAVCGPILPILADGRVGARIGLPSMKQNQHQKRRGERP